MKLDFAIAFGALMLIQIVLLKYQEIEESAPRIIFICCAASIALLIEKPE